MTLVNRINEQLALLDLLPLTGEQVACLADAARIEEAAAMLDDLAARCRVRLPLPEGVEIGRFDSEDEAREEGAEQALRYDAVALDEMATDEGRSYGNNEYYLIGFTGPDAAIAAACRGYITYWIRGAERDAA
jgi:hypothetical protein